MERPSGMDMNKAKHAFPSYIDDCPMQRARPNNWMYCLSLVALLSLCAIPATAAMKTDIVIFKNGDRLTGEFKSLKRGQLNLNTEATGTIGIEWDKISSVVSDQRVQVEVMVPV